jgi:hypothetical protein
VAVEEAGHWSSSWRSLGQRTDRGAVQAAHLAGLHRFEHDSDEAAGLTLEEASPNTWLEQAAAVEQGYAK